MPKYSSPINGIALSTAHMRTWRTVTAGSPGSIIRIYEILLAGEAASSNNYRVGMNRPTTAGTTPTTGTFDKLHPSSAAAGASVVTSFSVNPTLSAQDAVMIAFNGFGGAIRWVAPVDGELYAIVGVAQGDVSMASRNGSGNVSGHVFHEEF